MNEKDLQTQREMHVIDIQTTTETHSSEMQKAVELYPSTTQGAVVDEAEIDLSKKVMNINDYLEILF